MRALRHAIPFLLIPVLNQAGDFARNLPDEKMRQALIQQNFINSDAVIILKEQSYSIHPTEYEYRGVRLTGSSTTMTHIMIVKLFNESAVERYGNFEYGYLDLFGDKIKNGFEAKARVLKPDGTEWRMPKKLMQIKTFRVGGEGMPVTRKAIFMVPNLTAGDILQIEYTTTQLFSAGTSGIFLYHERDPVLYSNLYITLPVECTARYSSFPQGKIPDPQTYKESNSFGMGETRFWSLRNLGAIADEPYSFSFSDQSYMTAFVVEKWGQNGRQTGSWYDIAKSFKQNHLEGEPIPIEEMAKLGFAQGVPAGPVTFASVDSLYTALRKAVSLRETNSLYPQIDGISSIFNAKEGDASDLSYIMCQILNSWKTTANPVWVRDQRDGGYEKIIPTIGWFNRLGVLVNIAGDERLYDFDRCISSRFTTPWFLKPVDVMVLNEDSSFPRTLNMASSMADNVNSESHILSYSDSLGFYDKMEMTFKGAPAEEYRGAHYDQKKEDIDKKLEGETNQYGIQAADSVWHNDFLNDEAVNIRISGLASPRPTVIDSFLTLKPVDCILIRLHDRLFSTSRKTAVNLKYPFQMVLDWKVRIPKGYRLLLEPQTNQFSGPALSKARFESCVDEDSYKFTLKMEFPQRVISVEQFNRLMDFLDEALAKAHQEIIFKKL
jgi:hypothetical protein